LEKKLEIAVNFLKKTTISTRNPKPQVIVISNSEEEVEVGPQLVVWEQPQPVLESILVEKKELKQPISSGKVFLQEVFKKGPISNIILQCPRSRTRTMMK